MKYKTDNRYNHFLIFIVTSILIFSFIQLVLMLIVVVMFYFGYSLLLDLDMMHRIDLMVYFFAGTLYHYLMNEGSHKVIDFVRNIFNRKNKG